MTDFEKYKYQQLGLEAVEGIVKNHLKQLNLVYQNELFELSLRQQTQAADSTKIIAEAQQMFGAELSTTKEILKNALKDVYGTEDTDAGA